MSDTTVLAAEPTGIRIEGVDLSYGDNHVLKAVDLDIRPGEFFAFLGPSGCGKTTLLRLIAGFNEADRGRVLLNGQDISRLPPWKRDVGMVFQSYALWPHMSVRRNVAFGLEERRLPKPEIEKRVDEALGLVGLRAFAERRPSQLSGGQQQRVAVARTIAVRPKVLLLDEPLSNLDAKLRGEVRRELRQLQQRLGMTTIFVTHDQEEANTICDRIAVMNEGAVQQIGTPVELYERPQNLFVAGFLGSANILTGQLTGTGAQRVFAIGEGAALPLVSSHEPVPGARLVFRPQDVQFVAPGTPGALTGRIDSREFLGAAIRYALVVGGQALIVDQPFKAGDTLREPGEAAAVAVAPRALLWL